MTKGQKILLLEPSVAEAIYNDFVAHKDRKEYGKIIKQLMTSSYPEPLDPNIKTDDAQSTMSRPNTYLDWP